jgi:hypothetical protein
VLDGPGESPSAAPEQQAGERPLEVEPAAEVGGERDATVAAPEPEAPVQAGTIAEEVETSTRPSAAADPEREATATLDREGSEAVHDSDEMRDDDAESRAEVEPEPRPKKRWSLFRRGGDR